MSLNQNIVVRQRGKNLCWVSAKALYVAKGNNETVTWIAEDVKAKKKNFRVKFHIESPFVKSGGGPDGLEYHSEQGVIGPYDVRTDAAAAEYDYDLYGQDSVISSDPKIVIEEPPPGNRGG